MFSSCLRLRLRLARDHALDCPVLPGVEHVKGFLELLKLEAVRDERLHIYALFGQQVDGNGKAVEQIYMDIEKSLLVDKL